jgi:hypothetical protein
VPSDPAGLAHYQALRQVRRCFSDAAYRAGLAGATVDGDAQRRLMRQAVDEASELLLGAGP